MQLNRCCIAFGALLVLMSGCASSLQFRLAEQCDYERVTQSECRDRNARADEAYRSDIERILNER